MRGYEEQHEELLYLGRYEKKLEEVEARFENDKMFFGKRNKIENVPEVEEKLHELGVENVEFKGVLEIWQKKIMNSVEGMYEKHPEIMGCIGSMRVEKLPEGVYACAGIKMTEKGLTSEIQLNEKMFSKSNLELKIVDMELENFKGERWFAGRGLEGVIKHEMAHVMHLKMIADEENIAFGDKSKENFDLLSKKYYRNAIAVAICNESIKELNISPRDVGKHLSVYAASDFGEFFAEAISECETSKKPRPLAQKIYEKYNEYIANKEVNYDYCAIGRN